MDPERCLFTDDDPDATVRCLGRALWGVVNEYGADVDTLAAPAFSLRLKQATLLGILGLIDNGRTLVQRLSDGMRCSEGIVQEEEEEESAAAPALSSETRARLHAFAAELAPLAQRFIGTSDVDAFLSLARLAFVLSCLLLP